MVASPLTGTPCRADVPWQDIHEDDAAQLLAAGGALVITALVITVPSDLTLGVLCVPVYTYLFSHRNK